MQIRELDLKELYTAWELLKEVHTHLDYEAFEDIIYEMRKTHYTMIGIFEKEELFCYAGVAIETNLYHKRHLCIYELISRNNAYEYEKMMQEYLEDYARMGACAEIINYPCNTF